MFWIHTQVGLASGRGLGICARLRSNQSIVIRMGARDGKKERDGENEIENETKKEEVRM